MVINDKLKGSYYRAPLTKLASRRNIENQLNELVDYFNTISERLNTCFERITTDRETMKNTLLSIYEKTLHFKYIIDHFHYEVDQHITEKLNDVIDTFTSNISQYITPYDMNLFNHKGLTDDTINNQSEADTMEEWDRSVNSLSSSLGIKWYSGKLNDSDILNKLSNIIHITKINTYEGKMNEDYNNSNIILELFIYTNKGIAWLVLGQNATLGYNMIVKYISPAMEMNIKLASETHNVQKEYDLNYIDVDMILTDIIGSDPSGDDVYIKICTNIPSNTESGKDGYYLTSDPRFNSFEVKKNIINFSKGLMYRDNKDVGYFKREDDSLLDVNEAGFPKIITPNLLSPSIDKSSTINTDNETNTYYDTISIIKKDDSYDIQNKVTNPNGDTMSDLSDQVNGVVVENSDILLNKSYFNDDKMNSSSKDSPKYTKGEQNVDLTDYRTVGEISLIKENELSMRIGTVEESKTKVVDNDPIYGNGLKDKTIINKITNNNLLEMNNDESIYENLVTKVFEKENDDLVIYDSYTSELIVLFATNLGLYALKNGRSVLEKISNTVVYTFVKYNDTVYLGTNSGIFSFNFETNTLSPTNIVSEDFVSFYKGSDGLLYSFRKVSTSDIYTRPANESYNPSELAITDFIYVLYNNIWYEITEFASTILNLSGSDYKIGIFSSRDITDALIDSDFNFSKDKKPYLFSFNKATGKGYISANDKIVSFESVNINGTEYDFGLFSLDSTIQSSTSELTKVITKKDIIHILYDKDDDIFGKGIKFDSVFDFDSNNKSYVKNGRNTYNRLKVINTISDMKNFSEINDPSTVTNRLVKYINGNIYIIPSTSDIKNIVYVNGFYYVLTKVDRIYKLNENFDVEGIIYLQNIENITSADNIFMAFDTNGDYYVDTETMKYHKGFLESGDNSNKISVNIMNK